MEEASEKRRTTQCAQQTMVTTDTLLYVKQTLIENKIDSRMSAGAM